jgi:hypothetical protein
VKDSIEALSGRALIGISFAHSSACVRPSHGYQHMSWCMLKGVIRLWAVMVPVNGCDKTVGCYGACEWV